MVWLGRRCPDSGDVRWFYVSRGKKPNWTNISRGTPKPNHLLRLPRASTKLYQHLPSDKTIPSLHLPRSETKPSSHLPRNNTKHLPSKYEANHLYVSRVTFIFWLISFHITLTPFEPSRAEPNEPDNITSPEKIWTKPTLQLPSKYEPNHLYISRVTFIFWTAIFIYYLRPPPLVRSKVQTKRHLPSDIIHTIFTYLEYSAAGPQSKDGRVCVTTGEGAGGATWPLAKPYITLACGQVAPPAPSPVVTHALPSLDWGLWGFD